MKSSFILLCLLLTFAIVIKGCKALKSKPIIQPRIDANPQLGLKDSLKPLTSIAEEQELRQFWSNFQEAARNNDCKWIADISELLTMEYRNRNALLEDLEFSFPEWVREDVAQTSFDQLEVNTDSEGQYWRYRYDNGATSEGQCCAEYHFRMVGRRVRLVRIFYAG